MKTWFIAIFFTLFLLGCSATEFDTNAEAYNFTSVLSDSGYDVDNYVAHLEKSLKNTTDMFSRGDIALMLGRLKNDPDMLFLAQDFYYREIEYTTDWKKKALLYETLASLKDSRYYFVRAADAWRKTGNNFRSKLNFDLGFGIEPDFDYEIGQVHENKFFSGNFSSIIIGSSGFILDSNDVLISQADRVSRDWLSYQIQSPYSTNTLNTFSESLTYPEDELLPDIGWHEGGRIIEMKASGLKHEVATGTILKKYQGKWYAPNENGIFMFEVPADKVMYPTTRFLRQDIAMVIDTHGINMIVEQAISSNASAVMGCCDHPGKIKAAEYIAKKGIKVICNTDRFLPRLMGQDLNILGSAPFEIKDKKLIFGNRPIEITKHEPVVVMDAYPETFGVMYYDAPARYFNQLDEAGIPLNTSFVRVDGFGQMSRVIEKAEKLDSSIIAVRIFSSDDYNAVKAWLEKDITNKAILFHSEAYPYGYKLAREFKSQTSFDDINPIIL